MMKQVYNPYLPLNEYISDGEPHVIGNRLYIFGSHDREGGTTYCELDYVVYSAAVDNLKDWKCEGTIYRADQDPHSNKERRQMYAPDVVQGNDGRYYLYYTMGGEAGNGGFDDPISVAVCDTPAGKYEYLGDVRYADGRQMNRFIPFDPAVINDGGRILLYYGWALTQKEPKSPLSKKKYQEMMQNIDEYVNRRLDSQDNGEQICQKQENCLKHCVQLKIKKEIKTCKSQKKLKK